MVNSPMPPQEGDRAWPKKAKTCLINASNNNQTAGKAVKPPHLPTVPTHASTPLQRDEREFNKPRNTANNQFITEGRSTGIKTGLLFCPIDHRFDHTREKDVPKTMAL